MTDELILSFLVLQKLYFSKTIDKIFSSASKKQIHSEKLYLLQINWLLSNSTQEVEALSKKALAILDKAVVQHPESAPLLLQQIRLVRTLSPSEQAATLPKIFARALKDHSERFEAWREYITFLRMAYREEEMTKEQVEEAFLEAIRITTTLLPDVTAERAEISQIKQSVGAWFLEWVDNVEGIEGVRRVYRSLMKKSFPDLLIFMTCIRMEKQHAEDAEDSSKEISLLYDKAIQVDEKNEDTYLSFLKYLNDTKQIEAANKVLWRANKAVADKDAFSQRYQGLLEGKWREPTFGAVELEADMNMDVDESASEGEESS